MTPSPLIDRRHLDFVLYELLGVEDLLRYPRFAEHNRETFDAAIELAHRVALEKFLPHNRKSDLNEPQMVDGKVVMIPEIGEALTAFSDAGFMAVLADYADGGMQLPFVVATACDALFSSANPGTIAYPALARAAANLLQAYGTDEQKRLYMQPIIEGRYFGTMCLSEPQAGSSLGDIKTQAQPQADGSYRISGAKMWISAGDHEFGENIVHLVLARIVDAPPGVRGISLFIVPRWRVQSDGTRGERNDVTLAGLNHKMGQRGSVNTFLKFGEAGDCTGYLVGAPHQGLGYMFHMMNEERIGVGFGAVQQGCAGYLHSLQYARERRQGRHPDQKDPNAPPLALIEHADVRRMLLQQKCYVEGAQVLGLYAAQLIDRALDPDATVRNDSALLLELLTPIVKAWSSDYCLKANELAVQILGGYGYTREFPVEQNYRDNRINAIHEGTNGIQALDLLGRKAMMQNGAAVKLLLTRIGETCAQVIAGDDQVQSRVGLGPPPHSAGQKTVGQGPPYGTQGAPGEGDDVEGAAGRSEVVELDVLARQLQGAIAIAAECTTAAAQRMAAGQVRQTLANAQHYMTVLGHLTIAWTWLQQALAAQHALPSASQIDVAFYQGKLQACRFFFATELPLIEHAARLVRDVDTTAFDMRAEWF